MKLKTYIANHCHYDWTIIKSSSDSAIITTDNAVKWYGNNEMLMIDFDIAMERNVVTLKGEGI